MKKKSSTIDEVLVYNVINTPIVTFLEKRTTVEEIKLWEEEWTEFISRGNHQLHLSDKLERFYQFVEFLSEEIAQINDFNNAIAIKPLNQYEIALSVVLEKFKKKME